MIRCLVYQTKNKTTVVNYPILYGTLSGCTVLLIRKVVCTHQVNETCTYIFFWYR